MFFLSNLKFSYVGNAHKENKQTKKRMDKTDKKVQLTTRTYIYVHSSYLSVINVYEKGDIDTYNMQ